MMPVSPPPSITVVTSYPFAVRIYIGEGWGYIGFAMGVVGDLHPPSTQSRPAGQSLLHVPQWSGFVRRSKQPPGQLVWPEEQFGMQLPFKQNWFEGQEVPQYPQFLLSVLRSTHLLSHFTRSEGHTTGLVVCAVVGFVVMRVVGGVVTITGSAVGRAVVSTVTTSTHELPVVSTGTGVCVVENPAADRTLFPVSIG